MPFRDEIQHSEPGEPRTLEARFETVEDLRREYTSNLSQSGLFIATDAEFQPRELVVVELVLAFRDERVRLDGEVVAQRPAVADVPAGVAVQLLLPASELRDRLAPLVSDGPQGPPDDLPVARESRGAPRRAARVRAHLGSEGEPVRTRDLSTTGALVDAPPEPPAIGETIELSLRHPVSGEVYAIEGTVVRHHRDADAVSGVGVRFETNVVEQAGVERFVEDVQSAAHARSLGAIRGPIAPLGLANLLQMFGASAPRGTLRVESAGREGQVVFDAGLLQAVRLGEASGLKALARILALSEGSFEFHAEVDPEASDDPLGPLDAAVFEAMRQVDELARVSLPAGMAGGRISLDRERLQQEPGPLEKVEEAVVDLVGAGFPLERVLDVIPVADYEVHAAVRDLLERGVLVSSAR